MEQGSFYRNVAMRLSTILFIASLFFLCLSFLAGCEPCKCNALQQDTTDTTDIFWAIGKVESSHNDNAIGDGGKSIGRYQIQWAYWKDATDFDKNIGGKYDDVKDKDYAEKVMTAYFTRYEPEALKEKDWEVLSRLHNSGPNWANKKEKTDKYWEKIKEALRYKIKLDQ